MASTGRCALTRRGSLSTASVITYTLHLGRGGVQPASRCTQNTPRLARLGAGYTTSGFVMAAIMCSWRTLGKQPPAQATVSRIFICQFDLFHKPCLILVLDSSTRHSLYWRNICCPSDIAHCRRIRKFLDFVDVGARRCFVLYHDLFFVHERGLG